MGIAGLATYQNRSMYYSVGGNARGFDFDNGNPFMNQMLSFYNNESAVSLNTDVDSVRESRDINSGLLFGSSQRIATVGEYGDLKPYTRCITANIKTREMIASESDGQMIYSYQEEEQSFNIFINCDGENKTYTIKGIDENGQEIEEEFDPYNLDPEMMDFPEFSALCMYIRQTDETADLMTKMAFTDTSYFDNLFEKGDRISTLNDYAEEYRGINPALSELASSLFDAINDFFEKTMWSSGISDEKLSLLLTDRDSIPDTPTETVIKSNSKTENVSSEDAQKEYRKLQSFQSLGDTEAGEETIEEQPLPGFGMALAGSMGYGMKASLVTSDSTDEVIVRVKLATGGGKYESVDVNLSEFNPGNATAVEMFAYCQYKDAMGEGSGHTWGSWSAIKKVLSAADGMDFGSLDNIMNEKRNWTGALAKSKTYMENPKTGETLSTADLLKMFEEQNKLTAEKLKEGDDWRSMSDDDWDKLLSGIDNYIDTYKEDIRERVEKQMEAAQKAALEADPDMRSTAAQEAALSVAASGFDGGESSDGEETSETTGEDPGIDHEKNWTKKLKTDDQTVLRTAKSAQAMENMALNRMEEMVSNGVSTYDLYATMGTRHMRDRRLMNFA